MPWRRLLIAYITLEDPNHKHSWSGTNYYLLKAIRVHIGDADALGPVNPRFILFFLKALNFLTLRLINKRFDYRHSVFLSKVYSRIISKKLSRKKYDLIIAPTGNALLAYVETTIPIVYIGDRTVKGAYNYHEQFRNLFSFSYKQSVLIDSLTLNKAAMVSFPSQWAAQSAINEYGISPAKIKMIPFGANLDSIPPPNDFVKPANAQMKLLFIGVNWKDKGGDIAFETLSALNKAGIKSQLIVCGCQPPKNITHPDMIVEGFLNKENPEENQRLLNHFKTSDFLIVPTRYEAYGLVFCEAAAYSLTVLATNTGGISTIVKEGETGFLFPLEARGNVYAEKIIRIMKEKNLLQNLKRQSYQRYIRTLNWNSWVTEFKKAIDELY